MEANARQQVEEYVRKKFQSAHQKISDEYQRKMDALRRFGQGNTAYSIYADPRYIDLFAERVNALVMANANIRLEAYKLFGVAIDESLLAGVTTVKNEILAATISSRSYEAMKQRPHDPEHGKAIAASFRQQLTIKTQYVLNDVSCLIEEHKRMPKDNALAHYSATGPNARIIINGIDQSHNYVTTNEQNVFSQMRDVIKTQVLPEDQARLLERLAALEEASYKPTFGEQWIQFRAAAADYMTILLPFVPALMDIISRHT